MKEETVTDWDKDLEEPHHLFAEIDDDFQHYVFAKGGNVPQDTLIGVEVFNPRSEQWELHLLDDIRYG